MEIVFASSTYDLKAIMFHGGTSVVSGHFTGAIKIGNVWYLADDDKVIKLEKAEIIVTRNGASVRLFNFDVVEGFEPFSFGYQQRIQTVATRRNSASAQSTFTSPHVVGGEKKSGEILAFSQLKSKN
jgi:hypothetical protein